MITSNKPNSKSNQLSEIYNSFSKTLVKLLDFLAPLRPKPPLITKRITRHPRFNKDTAFLASPGKAPLRARLAGWDIVGAIAMAAGAVVWDRPGAWVRPYADAGGSDVAFVLARGGNAGWAAVAAVAFDERVRGLARGESENSGGGEE